MTLLHEAVEFKKLDVRLIERNIARGTLTREEVEKSTKSLPDDAENAEWVSIEDLAATEEEPKPVASRGNPEIQPGSAQH